VADPKGRIPSRLRFALGIAVVGVIVEAPVTGLCIATGRVVLAIGNAMVVLGLIGTGLSALQRLRSGDLDRAPPAGYYRRLVIGALLALLILGVGLVVAALFPDVRGVDIPAALIVAVWVFWYWFLRARQYAWTERR